MYNFCIYLYLIGVAIYSRFSQKVRTMWRGERDAFRVLREQVEDGSRYVWFHAASLGEFEQGRPLMEQLRRERPELKILLTFFSPSGYEVRKDYAGADIICYLPLDTPRNARRFLRLIRPEAAFFIKYEFWYNYLHILKHRGVPVYSVSSIFRDGQVFFRWYGRQYGRVLKCFTHFYVQNEKSRELLATIGIDNVTVTGDTRFDRVLQIRQIAPATLPPKEQQVSDFIAAASKGQGSGDGPDKAATPQPLVFVAGSSWPPDEEIFLRYFNEHPEWTLIIAPHVIGEDHLQQIEHLLAGRRVVRLSQLSADDKPSTHTADCGSHPAVGLGRPASSAEELSTPLPPGEGPGGGSVEAALLIDCFGLLSSLYRYATVSYVGGGFGVGIHNTLEAAVWGAPVLFGPNNEKFQEAQGLKQCGGGIEIDGYEAFCRVMDGFAASPPALQEAGRQAAHYVEQLGGATAKILSDVEL